MTYDLVSVLIVSYNTRELLLEALEPLAGAAATEVVVVDNASDDGSADAVELHYPAMRLVRAPSNLGFAGGVNRAAREAGGDVLVLLNPDATLPAAGPIALANFLTAHDRAAAVGAALHHADGRPQAAAFRFPGLVQVGIDIFAIGRLAQSRVNGRVRCDGSPVQIDHPLGACMAIRRAAWEDVGPLDEGYFMYVEEVDWCRRARQRGWEIWHDPRVVAIHHGGAATRQRADAMFVELWRSRLRYYQRFHGPLYNRCVRTLVRLGLAAAARTARPERRQAIAQVRQLVG
jgi:N-acetylglucosaminyl-diphospho-decaprenol L-rhamnosyltransferase